MSNATTPTYSGKFAIYEKKDGGMIIAYHMTGEEEPQSIEVPAFAVSIAKQAAEGKGPLGGLSGMLGF